MLQLNLPRYKPRIEGEQIFCLVRKKMVSLTPEEWVRQHFLNLVIAHLHYPKAMIKLEHTIHYFKNTKRSDITILDKNGDVFLLVECKSFKLDLTQKVVSQLSTYNKVLASRYLAISNGLQHFVWEKDDESYNQIMDFPSYG